MFGFIGETYVQEHENTLSRLETCQQIQACVIQPSINVPISEAYDQLQRIIIQHTFLSDENSCDI